MLFFDALALSSKQILPEQFDTIQAVQAFLLWEPILATETYPFGICGTCIHQPL